MIEKMYVYLESPSFIESLTSESNLAAVEYADVVLKCFAVGKPSPKIRWYQIDESNGSIRGQCRIYNYLSLLSV